MATSDPVHDLRVIGIVGAAHGGSHYFHLVLPPLFPILKATFGVSFTELGLLVSVLFATSGLCQTPAGFLVDRIGAARVLAAGLALLGVGAMLAGLAPVFWALLPAAVLMGLGNSVFHPADYAILSHHVAARRMARAFSIHTVGGTLGWAIAPVLVAGIAAVVSWRAALMFSGALGLALALLVYSNRALLETPGHKAAAPAATATEVTGHLRLFTSTPILLCFAFFALQATSFIALQNFMPVTLHQLYNLDLMTATTTVTALMIGSAGGTMVGGVWADRSGQHRLIIVCGLALAAIVLTLIGRVQFPLPALLAAVALAGALAGLTTPSRDMLVRAAAPPGASGKVFGFVYSGLDLGATLTPILIGSLLDAGRIHAVFVVAPLAMAASILTVTTISTRRTGPVTAET
jgi:MFS family permease